LLSSENNYYEQGVDPNNFDLVMSQSRGKLDNQQLSCSSYNLRKKKDFSVKENEDSSQFDRDYQLYSGVGSAYQQRKK